MDRSLLNFSKYDTQLKMQEAIIRFMVDQLVLKEELFEPYRSFRVIDNNEYQNREGVITREKLKSAFKVYGETREDYVDNLFEKVYNKLTDSIEFSSWVTAVIDKEKLLTKERLKLCFNLFDIDGGGSISADEVRDMVAKDDPNIDIEVWNKILAEVDEDGSGEIDEEEFTIMMEKYLQNEKTQSSPKLSLINLDNLDY